MGATDTVILMVGFFASRLVEARGCLVNYVQGVELGTARNKVTSMDVIRVMMKGARLYGSF